MNYHSSIMYYHQLVAMKNPLNKSSIKICHSIGVGALHLSKIPLAKLHAMMTVGPPGAMCFNASRAKSRPASGAVVRPQRSVQIWLL